MRACASMRRAAAQRAHCRSQHAPESRGGSRKTAIAGAAPMRDMAVNADAAAMAMRCVCSCGAAVRMGVGCWQRAQGERSRVMARGDAGGAATHEYCCLFHGASSIERWRGPWRALPGRPQIEHQEDPPALGVQGVSTPRTLGLTFANDAAATP